MKFIVLLLVLLSGPVVAADLIVGVMTRHTLSSGYTYEGVRQSYNESNNLIGVSSGKFSVATLKNSYYKRALLAMYTPFSHKYLDLKVGLSTGYGHIMPQVSYKGLTPVFSFGAKYKMVNISLFSLNAFVITYKAGN